MKRPKDFYLRHYWRDLSDDEERALSNERKWDQPLWLDSPVRGDWRDWDDNVDKYEKILDQEARRQLGDLVDWSTVTKKPIMFERDVKLLFRLYCFRVRCQNWDETMGDKWDNLARKWRSLLKRAGFTDLYHVMEVDNHCVLKANLFGPKWNTLRHQIENNFVIDFLVINPFSDLKVSITLGPFYNARALKLDKMIPKAIKTIRQIVLEIRKEINKTITKAVKIIRQIQASK